MNQKEKLFYNKLKNIFIGENVEGISGFANLMRMKSTYFDQVFVELDREIKEKTQEFPEFREELYNKLHTFLKRYFTDSGSILYRRTTPDSKIYEKVYDNEKDVSLFWKTHMLYYVKTEKIWKPLTIEGFEKDEKNYDVEFDVSELEGKRSNIKKGIIFELGSINQNKIAFKVKRSSHGRKTKIKKIRRKLNNEKDIPLEREDLEYLFKTYKKQNEVDFFINKDAESFLKEQFDLYIKHYIMDDESIFRENRLKKLKRLREIAYKIIEFVSQFEDELVKIWNKPKFVLNSNYVVSLARLAGEGGEKVIELISTHKGFKEQIKEWKQLGILEEDEEITNLFDEGELKKEYRFLPIDTKYFEDLKLDILSLFDNVDENLDGWVIHSENYQALNTILIKFRGEISSIYIDPPYNTGLDEFVYRDQYQSSSWLSMMENRLELSKELLKKSGSTFISIDYHEMPNLRKLCDKIYGNGNFRNTILFRRGVKNVQAQFDEVDSLTRGHEYVVFYSKNRNTRYPNLFKELDEERPGGWNNHWRGTDRPTMRYELFGITPESGQWRWSGERSRKAIENYENMKKDLKKQGKKITQKNIDHWYKKKLEETKKERFDLLRYNEKNNTVEHYIPPKKEEMLTDVWFDLSPYGSKTIKSLFGEKKYDNPKPVLLVKRIIRFSTGSDDIIMDFFAGSGTTAHSVLDLNVEENSNRKFLLIEMENQFKKLINSRLKKISYTSTWKGGTPQKNHGTSIFYKYYSLEQYEQTLKNCVYGPSRPFKESEEPVYNQYIFVKDKKMLDTIELDLENDKVKIDFSKLYSNIDLAETLSNLKGKKIKEVSKNSVTFEDGEKIEYDNLNFETIKPLIWW